MGSGAVHVRLTEERAALIHRRKAVEQVHGYPRDEQQRACVGSQMSESSDVVYWWETEPVDPRPPLIGSDKADVCIVGAGYTGLWTAYYLKTAEPSLDIVVVEASWAGAGASGHNDGFAGTQLNRSLHHLLENHPRDEVALLRRELCAAVLEIGDFCDQHDIEADYEHTGYFEVATNEGQRRRLDRDLSAAEEIRQETDFTLYEGAAARERLGSPLVVALLRDSSRALLNPHRLCRGLARVVGDLGIRLYENSPALEVRSNGATTSQGEVTAEATVVATNAWQHTFPQFRRRVTPIWSHSMVSQPLSQDQLKSVAWPRREGFEDKRNLGTIGRLTKDNRVLWAGRYPAYHFRSDLDPRHRRYDRSFAELRAAWSDWFPMWTEVRFTHAYGGPVGLTARLEPYVGRRDGIYYGYGYSGHGVGPSVVVAKALRDLVLKRDSHYLALPFMNQPESRIPPEPLRFVGARLTTELLARQDKNMDRGSLEAGEPFLLRVLRKLP